MIRASFLLVLACSGGLWAEEGSPLFGSFIRSKDWIIRRAPRKVEEFDGDVRYRRGPRAVTSDHAVYDHEAQTLKASGRVRAEETFSDGSVLEARGRKADYDLKSRLGAMTGEGPSGRVYYTRTAPGRAEKDSGEARRMDWDWNTETVFLSGGATGTGPEGDFWSDRARNHVPTRTVVLEGRRPVATARQPKWSAAVQADKITAREEGSVRKVRGDGSAEGWILFEGGAGALRKR